MNVPLIRCCVAQVKVDQCSELYFSSRGGGRPSPLLLTHGGGCVKVGVGLHERSVRRTVGLHQTKGWICHRYTNVEAKTQSQVAWASSGPCSGWPCCCARNRAKSPSRQARTNPSTNQQQHARTNVHRQMHTASNSLHTRTHLSLIHI